MELSCVELACLQQDGGQKQRGGGRRRKGEVHGEENKARGREFRGLASYEIFFGFYALLAERFSLRIRRVRGHGAWRSTRTLLTVLTALTIHIFEAENFFVAF